MGSMSVSSCRSMFVSCVHPVAVLNAAFSMTCSLLMLVEDAREDHLFISRNVTPFNVEVQRATDHVIQLHSPTRYLLHH